MVDLICLHSIQMRLWCLNIDYCWLPTFQRKYWRRPSILTSKMGRGGNGFFFQKLRISLSKMLWKMKTSSGVLSFPVYITTCHICVCLSFILTLHHLTQFYQFSRRNKLTWKKSIQNLLFFLLLKNTIYTNTFHNH